MRVPLLLEEQVPRDGEQVRAYRRQIDAASSVPQPDERLRDDVVGHVRIARQEQHESVNVTGMGPIEAVEVDHRLGRIRLPCVAEGVLQRRDSRFHTGSIQQGLQGYGAGGTACSEL